MSHPPNWPHRPRHAPWRELSAFIAPPTRLPAFLTPDAPSIYRHRLPPRLPAHRSPLFVTWNKAHAPGGGLRLRGCIGTLEPRPLHTAVRDYALTRCAATAAARRPQARRSWRRAPLALAEQHRAAENLPRHSPCRASPALLLLPPPPPLATSRCRCVHCPLRNRRFGPVAIALPVQRAARPTVRPCHPSRAAAPALHRIAAAQLRGGGRLGRLGGRRARCVLGFGSRLPGRSACTTHLQAGTGAWGWDGRTIADGRRGGGGGWLAGVPAT